MLKSKFEKEIERIIQEENYNSTAVASPELLQKLAPLQQKLNVISELGDSMRFTDHMLEKAGIFLQNLEDTWNELKNEDISLMANFTLQ